MFEESAVQLNILEMYVYLRISKTRLPFKYDME